MSNESENSGVFWLRDSKNNPVTLVAWRFEEATIRYATSTHNPPDAFSRKHARDKALGRLKQGRPDLVPTIPHDKAISVEVTIAKHIVQNQRGDTALPEPPRIWSAAANSIDALDRRHHNRQKRMQDKKCVCATA